MSTIVFQPNIDNITSNILRLNNTNVTVDGINFKYDENTGIITVNGTRNTKSERIDFIYPYCNMTNLSGVSASFEYIGGTISNGGSLVLELPTVEDGTGTGGASGNRFHIDMQGASKKVENLTLKTGYEKTAIIWAWPGTGNEDFTFNNYQVRIKVENSSLATDWSPNSKEISVGSPYGTLPSLAIPKYSFDGWFKNGNKITSSSIVDEDGTIILWGQFTQSTYTNTIHHWVWEFIYGEGNNDGKDAYKIGDTTFEKDINERYTLNYSYMLNPPNGFGITENVYMYGIGNIYQTTPLTQAAQNEHFEYSYHPIYYKINYNLNGGTQNPNNPNSYIITYGKELYPPTKNNHTFKGWELNYKLEDMYMDPDENNNWHYGTLVWDLQPGDKVTIEIDNAILLKGNVSTFSLRLYDFTVDAPIERKVGTFSSSKQSFTFNPVPESAAGHSVRMLIYAGEDGFTSGVEVEYKGMKVKNISSFINKSAIQPYYYTSSADLYYQMSRRNLGDIQANALWMPNGGGVRIYVDGQWKIGIPYIYINNTESWKKAVPYIYDNDKWNLCN